MFVTLMVGGAMSFPGVTYVNALQQRRPSEPTHGVDRAADLYFRVMRQILLEGVLVASTFAGSRTQDMIVRLKAWFARHGRQAAMIGPAGIGTALNARGLVRIS